MAAHSFVMASRQDDNEVSDLEKRPSHTAIEEDSFDLPEDFENRSKKLVRKFDLRLLPVLVSLYVMSFLDRVNIGEHSRLGTRVNSHG